MKKILITILLFSNFICFGQKKNWINNKDEEVRKSETDLYYTLERKNDTLYKYKRYKNGTLITETDYLDSEMKIKNGYRVVYYESTGIIMNRMLWRNNKTSRKLSEFYDTEGKKMTFEGQEEVVLIPKKTKDSENKVFEMADVNPEYKGGMGKVMEYLRESTKKFNLTNTAKARILITLVVEKDGSVSNVKNINMSGKPQDPKLIKEAIRIVSEMPNWIPGTNNGVRVRVKQTLPVSF